MTHLRFSSCKAFLALLAAVLLEAGSPARAAGGVVSRASGTVPTAALTQSPLVMRMSKDEFRIAFGIKGIGCTSSGCHGRIRYRVNWKVEDGTSHWQMREVDYAVVPHSTRTITVDRQYFDTSEGAHTTDVVRVVVTRITCNGGVELSGVHR